MIRLHNLSLQRGPLRLLDHVDLTVHPGHKVGLIGANGAGKSSLFALLQGQLQPDSGDCLLPAQWRIAHMQQEITTLERSALDYVMDGDTRLRELQQQMEQAQQQQDGTTMGRLNAELDAADAWTAESRASRLLAGLGFAEGQMQRPVSSFSGGWRMRLNLAHTLMCPSDLLLLDEPTNHLDLDAILWLEGWLQQYPGTLLLISHDRDFMDAVVQQTVHFERQQLVTYRGGYSAFERARAERMLQQQQAYEKQQAERAHMQDFIRRFKAKASKAKQAQSRIKALERMEELAPAHFDSPFHFSFREADKTSATLISLRDADLGHGEKTILCKVNLQVVPGMRMALLGPNGAGKSTLVKSLSGELPLLDGEVVRGENLAIGYFSQHQLDSLDAKASPLLHLQRIAPDEAEQKLRDFLGGFDFRGDRCDEPVVNFSGGEKARLALALIAWQKPNLLLLDEPTNHLDLEMRHALGEALQHYKGAMLLVSHDRHLLKTTVDEFMLVADGVLTTFDGELEDYSRWLQDFRLRQQQTQHKTTPDDNDRAPAGPRIDRRTQRQAEAAVRKQLAPHRKQAEKLEQALDTAQEQLAAIEEQLTDNSLYEADAKDRLKQLLAEQTRLKQDCEELEMQWLESMEQLEVLEQELAMPG